MGESTRPTAPGIRANWRQFVLHVVLVFATGLTLGAERTVVPVLGREVFGVASLLVIGSFVVSFGLVKAVLNLYAGKWGDAYGRKPVLVAGWATALPLPFVLIYAPSWGWIAAGNVLLGVNQGLTWSMAVNAKIDLAGPERRGLAVGIDESFGYVGVAVGAWVTGVIAARTALRPEPFYFQLAVVVVALLVAAVLVEETVGLARTEGAGDASAALPFRAVLRRATVGDRTLFAAAQAGHVENFVDTLVWLALPLFLASRGVGVGVIGVVVGVHSGAYLLQLATGELGDRVGRKPPVVAGMVVAGLGVLAIPMVEGVLAWTVASGVAGVGMALLYPNLLTVAGDAAHPSWRAAAMGVYRLWRDLGYAVGAVVIGLAMTVWHVEAAFTLTGLAMLASGGVVVWLMEETHPALGTHRPAAGAPVPARSHGED